jgi:hypothetical protein
MGPWWFRRKYFSVAARPLIVSSFSEISAPKWMSMRSVWPSPDGYDPSKSREREAATVIDQLAPRQELQVEQKRERTGASKGFVLGQDTIDDDDERT